MNQPVEKRTVDMQIIGDWVEPHTRVLDLGCGAAAAAACGR
jgi:tRNA1(Val) A37 N6-methylase TrmN6